MRRTVVTGASRGLGLEFVRQLSAAGDEVVATARDPERADALRDVARNSRGRVVVVPLDVADRVSVSAAADRIRSRWTGVDLLINNAGIWSAGLGPDEASAGPLEHLDPDAMLEVMRVNATGPVMVTQALRPLLSAARAATVVNLTSGMASIANTTSAVHYAYSASKAALNMLSRNLAAELRGEGTAVIAISPGWVRTDMGGPAAPLDPPESVKGMLTVIDGLDASQSGRFWDHTGAELPW